MKDYVKAYPEAAKERWNAMFGAYIPQISYTKEQEGMFIVIQYINEWVNEYPE